MNIAIITREIHNLTKHGGIGTSIRYLCEFLLKKGHSITIYYTGRPSLRLIIFSKCISNQGFKFIPVIPWCPLILRDNNKRVLYTYKKLSHIKHDFIIFNDYMADSYYFLKNKQSNKNFTNTILGIIAHGSSYWLDEIRNCISISSKKLRLYEMEKYCYENADFLVSPSNYLINWMKDQGFVLPHKSYCIPNFVSTNICRLEKDHKNNNIINELVFFGRLEKLKGIDIFCDALLLIPINILKKCNITFLGKSSLHTIYKIRKKLSPLIHNNIKIKFIRHFDSYRAKNYLMQNGRFAIMPSLRENSPCTVLECLENNIPFLSTNSGGGPEFVHHDRHHIFFTNPNAEDISKKLINIIGKIYNYNIQSTYNFNYIEKSWDKILKYN